MVCKSALLGGAAFRLAGLPRIVGYSAAGMLLAGLGLSDGPLQGTDRLIVDLALALLLTSAAESVVSFWAIFAVLR